LKVAPVAEVPGILPRNVPQIYISRTVSHADYIDFPILVDETLAKLIGQILTKECDIRLYCL
jgi:hypothetical protein